MNKLAFGKAFVVLGSLYFSCSPTHSKEAIRFQQYYAQGEQLYGQRCSNCHQKSGKGLGLVYPPLEKSDYLDKDFTGVICLIKYGKKGEIVVNGKSFNQPMPGIPALTELELAELATYLYNTWGRDRGIVETQQISKAVEKCVP